MRKSSLFFGETNTRNFCIIPSCGKNSPIHAKHRLMSSSSLYGTLPSHIDGHHHMHLCANILMSKVIPRGIKMRRNFSFWPGEKSPLNRAYRAFDRWSACRQILYNGLSLRSLASALRRRQLGRVTMLAKSSNVELMTHPVVHAEADYFMSDEFRELLQPLESAVMRWCDVACALSAGLT